MAKVSVGGMEWYTFLYYKFAIHCPAVRSEQSEAGPRTVCVTVTTVVESDLNLSFVPGQTRSATVNEPARLASPTVRTRKTLSFVYIHPPILFHFKERVSYTHFYLRSSP